MRRAELRRRARAGVGRRLSCDAICLACGWQGTVEYARPAERWTCREPDCGRREVVRDEGEAERPERAKAPQGEA
jgi:predicted RNA-binding Zn-ribbon protein involved in translation (DUF1610 family)